MATRTMTDSYAGQASGATEPSVDDDGAYAVEARRNSFGTVVRMYPKKGLKPVLIVESRPQRISIEWNTDRTRAEQVDVLREMLSRFRAWPGGTLTGAVLQISLGDHSYPEYVERLMHFANRDPAWQESSARGERALHEYIAQATQNQALLPELDQIFAAVGVRPVIRHVEKCSSMAPDTMPKELKRRLAPEDRHGRRPLPAGCQLAQFDLLMEN
jgi:hypothetical protein